MARSTGRAANALNPLAAIVMTVVLWAHPGTAHADMRRSSAPRPALELGVVMDLQWTSPVTMAQPPQPRAEIHAPGTLIWPNKACPLGLARSARLRRQGLDWREAGGTGLLRADDGRFPVRQGSVVLGGRSGRQS